MIHPRQDYNERIQDNANIIPADEPVFLFRGQDIYAPNMLREYADKLQSEDVDDEQIEMITAIRKHADSMDQWQNERNSKFPDMPEGESIYNI